MRRLQEQLGWKIGLLLSTILLLVMASLSVGDYLWQRHTFSNNLKEHISEEAWTVAILLHDSENPLERQQLLMEVAQALDQSSQHTWRHHELFILDDQAIVQASNTEKLLGQPMGSESVLQVLRGETTFASGVMWHGNHLSFYGVVPIYGSQGPLASPVGAVHIAEPLHPIQVYLNEFLTQRLLFLAVVTGMLILLVNLLINRTVSLPLNTLVRRMERVHHGDLNTRVPVHTTDELGQIGQAFNAMIQAVQEGQQTIEQERSCLALLYDINRRLASAVDWEEVVDLLVRVPGEIVDAVGCVFLSFDERTERLSLEGGWGLGSDDLINLELHLQGLKDHLRCLTCQPRLARVGISCPLLPQQIVEKSGIRSILCLHLAQGEQTVGFLDVYLRTEAPPPAEKVELLNAIAGEMAAVVAAAQLRVRELAMLAGLDQTVHTHLDLQEMLERVLTQTRKASRAAQGALFLYDEQTATLQPVAFEGVGPEQLDDLQARALDAIARREPWLICSPAPPLPCSSAQSVLATPLVLDGAVLGVFLLADHRPQVFSQRQVTLMSAIANQTALIIRNSQLYASVKSQAILEERGRLAREIHDSVVQTLGYLKLQLSRMQGWTREGNLDRLCVEVADLQEVVEEAYAEARDAIAGLRIGLNANETLENILAEYVQGFSVRYQLPVELKVEGNGSHLQPTAVLHLLRIAQEGLTNIRKHARATHAWIELDYQPNRLVLTLSDDGRGVNPQVMQRASFRGVQFMRERAERLGGQLAIHLRRPHGTEVQVTIPLVERSRSQEHDLSSDAHAPAGPELRSGLTLRDGDTLS